MNPAVKGSSPMRLAIFFGFCVVLLSLAGCAGAFDPFQRPANWALTGAADETIAQQAANKSDLLSGESEPGSNGVAASAALDKALGANGAGTAAGLQTAPTPVSNAVSISTGN
jgi:hypothetical protein